ncbi:DUF4136 domain-containing protein [Limibacter armeniacum]|uniref:DUF4136 domain-containing protein n=1 Tax=Limibacter armeniacum TaxID=466084 RepID=UPI002FE5CB70
MAQVKSEYKKGIDFSKYETYSFGGWHEDGDSPLGDKNKSAVEQQLKKELKSRGLVQTDQQPDAYFILLIVLQNDAGNSMVGNNQMGEFEVHTDKNWSDQVSKDYLKGYFAIEMYDRDTRKLVWKGTVRKIGKAHPEKRATIISKKLKKLMKKFPIK